MSAKGTGAMFLFMGLASFVLPLIGVQFRILSIFGGARWIVSVILCIVGVIMLAAGKE